jgi:glyoxylase-like metal-dependent hydrolase (beta-lactamase superfamily II)
MVNFFIMQAGEKYIAFDVGTNSAQTEIELQKLSISADDIISVFITHSDFDHIGSVDLFENAIIYTGDTGNSQFPDIPHHIMPDGGIIDIYGTAIQCLYTPGHTIDSVSFLVDGKYLFVGDLLVPPNTARYSAELQITNKEKVLGINEVEYVFSGHFGLFKDVWLISLIFN